MKEIKIKAGERGISLLAKLIQEQYKINKMTEIKFKPLGKRVLLSIPEIEEKTGAGIIKSDTMLEEEKAAKLQEFPVVVAIGDEVTKVKVGDKILPAVRSLDTIFIDEVQYGLIEEGWIAGIKID